MDPEPGEQIFFHGHPSWRAMLYFYIKGIGIAVAAGVIAGVVTRIASHSINVPIVVGAVLVVYVVVLILGFVRRISTTYTITDQRLTIDHGLLARDVHETRLSRVQNVNSSQTLLERMLYIGDVDFDTAGSAEYDFTFRGVAHPHEIVRTVDRALKDLQESTPGMRTPGV